LTDFQNPQQEPGTERRLLLAFAITFLIIIASQPLMKKYGPKPPEPAPVTQQTSTPPAVAPQATAALAAPGKNAASSSSAAASVPAVTKQASAESEVVVENDLYKITFSNRGGLVKSWVLKKFDDDKGQPLELVNASAAAKYGFPLSLFLYDGLLQQRLNQALYVTSNSGSLHAPADITFEFADQDLVVSKSFHFDHSYLVKVETSARYKGVDVQAYPAWPSSFGDGSGVAAYGAGQIEYQNSDKIERLAPKKISGGNTVNGPFQWAGPTDRYFAAVFLPEDPENAALVTLNNQIDIPKDAKRGNASETVKVNVLGAAVGDRRGPTVEQLYVGPKSLEVVETIPVPTLHGASPDLTGLVNFGFFGIIAKPLFLWLKWTYYHIISNWGWAIALQTLIINLLLMPLRITQLKSALKMQKIQPQAKAIQTKYEKYSLRDPRKAEMNQEIAALYKREGVNPVAGCLPLIIQMPFLFAYYSMLGAVIDLRQAHWLWIKDLSSPDALYLLPGAVFVSMFLVQRMTPQGAMDPQQQKMMNIFMPVMLAYVSSNLAAGLCLYWSVGNLISIVQQMVMNRTSLGQEMRELAEKRARKKK
jgi:YidC/Oxa1 family membrane protein insertase